MTSFGLVMEHDKSEIFHFSRVHNDSNPELDLSAIGAPILKPKTYWRYLGFYFDRRLSFKEHVWFYSTKALTTVKAMGMLGNSTRGLLPLQKRLLYRSCVVLIATYGFRLWYFSGAPTRHRSLFWQPCNARLLSGFWVPFTLLQLVELRLWKVSFLFISISRSWSSDPVLGLLRFFLNMYYFLFLVLATPRVLTPIHSLLLFSLMHRVLG